VPETTVETPLSLESLKAEMSRQQVTHAKEMAEMKEIVNKLVQELKDVSQLAKHCETQQGKVEFVLTKMFNSLLEVKTKVTNLEKKTSEAELKKVFEKFMADRENLGCKGDELAKKHDEDHTEDPDAASGSRRVEVEVQGRTETQGESSQAGVAGKSTSDTPQAQEQVLDTEDSIPVDVAATQSTLNTEETEIAKMDLGVHVQEQSTADALEVNFDLNIDDTNIITSDSTTETDSESSSDESRLEHEIRLKYGNDITAYENKRYELLSVFDPGSQREQGRVEASATTSESSSDSDFEKELKGKQKKKKK
jgi:hypothetical protein